jgi:S-adenosyl-L-methionine hydrolase (adenosine-forming)
MVPIITFTTDLGLDDAYVAAMKGVILDISPQARLVDICHTVKPQDITQAAFVLDQAYPFFPAGTIHVVVVDPGVGTTRKAIILKTGSALFVAPDNGVLSYVLRRSPGSGAGRRFRLGPGQEAVVLDRPWLWRDSVSPTFHGRDIFAPVAARLSLGQPVTDFGDFITSLVVLPLAAPRRAKDGSVTGRVIHIDGFGNLVTNIKEDKLPEDRPGMTVRVGGQRITGLSRTFTERPGLLALIGSSGYLEIARRDGDAAATLGVRVGDGVNIIPYKAGVR